MKYENIKKAIFLSRPNRFIAVCNVDGREEICHVKNTGRCRELLIENAICFLEESNNLKRKTKYDLVAVVKDGELFNIDSQAPNKVVGEWIKNGGLFDNVNIVKPEYTYKKSRFDFYVKCGEKKVFVEVKGVTLEENGVLLFPDAPTERGVKHIKELISATKQGYDAYIIFIIQTEKAKYFTPNTKTHKEFSDALRMAEAQGVKIHAYTCKTTPDSLEIKDRIEVLL